MWRWRPGPAWTRRLRLARRCLYCVSVMAIALLMASASNGYWNHIQSGRYGPPRTAIRRITLPPAVAPDPSPPVFNATPPAEDGNNYYSHITADEAAELKAWINEAAEAEYAFKHPQPPPPSPAPPPPAVPLVAQPFYTLYAALHGAPLVDLIEACDLKYPPDVLRSLTERFRALSSPDRGGHGGRVFLAGMLRDSVGILPAWMSAVDALITALGPGAVVVSIVESGSTDATPIVLRQFGAHLRRRGVAAIISVGVDHVRPVFVGNDDATHRIDYLARLRNAALAPLFSLGRRRAASEARSRRPFPVPSPPLPKATLPGQWFDRVLFLNDVMLCGGDLLKLLASPADLACGFDFNGGGFWDNWVYEPLAPHGFPPCFDAPLPDPLRLQMPRSPLVDATRRRLDPTEGAAAMARNAPRPAPCASEQPRPVGCCWNGAVAVTAAAFYAGVRFRRGGAANATGPFPGTGIEGARAAGADCDASECSLLCRDLRRLGFGRIEADPTIQVGYTYESLWAWRLTANFSAGEAADGGALPGGPVETARCCELPPGKLHVDWGRCFGQALAPPCAVESGWTTPPPPPPAGPPTPAGPPSPMAEPILDRGPWGVQGRGVNAPACLGYTPEWWEVPWYDVPSAARDAAMGGDAPVMGAA